MADHSDDLAPEGKGKRNYEVGYGKPPSATRFKPGQSGNPKGRQKGTQNFGTYLSNELTATVTVTRDGKPRKMPKVQLIAAQLVASAIKGNLKSIEALIKLVGLMTPASPPAETLTTLSDAERQKMTDYLASVLGGVDLPPTGDGTDRSKEAPDAGP